MSLGIAFKGPEGIVLAADSRVTLMGRNPNEGTVFPSTFDNATKLLRISRHKFVGIVTYGLGALGQQEFRTAHSFMPEFESDLRESEKSTRRSVEDFAIKLSEFFTRQWSALMPEDYSDVDMIFLIGGYDEDAPYGRIFQVGIPSNPKPKELHSGEGAFGPVWGGQLDFASRLIHGYDGKLPSLVQEFLDLSDNKTEKLQNLLRGKLNIPIPYQFLSLQDCVDLSIFLIRTTIDMQSFYIGIRGVGGAIDVATITRTDGFKAVQEKEISGERSKI